MTLIGAVTGNNYKISLETDTPAAMNALETGWSLKISTPSMVYEADHLTNVRLLAEQVDNIEIVLFHTVNEHNIPNRRELRLLNTIAEREKITYTVHLPSNLEIAAKDVIKRKQSVEMVRAICRYLAELNPIHFILHIPFSRPTLMPDAGLYFHSGDPRIDNDWTCRARESLERLHDLFKEPSKILVENINYAPSFLDPFFDSGLCEFCLDIGHLILGRETVMPILQAYLPFIREIHMHGLRGHADHFSLSELPEELVGQCLRLLKNRCFAGLINLEVFTPLDLKKSLTFIDKVLQST